MFNAHEYVSLWNRFEKQLTEDELAGVLKRSTPVSERGKNLIYPQRLKEWESCVKSRICSIYDGAEVINAIDAMELLDKDAPVEVVTDALFNYPHTPFSINIALNVIATFSKKGPEYVEELATIAPEFKQDEKFLDEIKSQNAVFEQELAQKQNSTA